MRRCSVGFKDAENQDKTRFWVYGHDIPRLKHHLNEIPHVRYPHQTLSEIVPKTDHSIQFDSECVFNTDFPDINFTLRWGWVYLSPGLIYCTAMASQMIRFPARWASRLICDSENVVETSSFLDRVQ
jgi:hypothetical protein